MNQLATASTEAQVSAWLALFVLGVFGLLLILANATSKRDKKKGPRR
jgi:hypothetical protein